MVIVFDQVTLMMTVQIYVIYDLLCLGSEVSETFLNVSFYSFFFFTIFYSIFSQFVLTYSLCLFSLTFDLWQI